MKKIAVFLVILSVIILLLLQISAAGEMRKVEIEDKEKSFFTLKERDLIRFNWGNEEHKIMVRQVNEHKNTADLTLFIEGVETPQYFSVSQNQYIKIDFNRDGINDLTIRMDSINEGEITLELSKITEKKDTITSRVIENVPRVNPKVGWGIVVGIIILGLIVYSVILKKFKSEEGRKLKKK